MKKSLILAFLTLFTLNVYSQDVKPLFFSDADPEDIFLLEPVTDSLFLGTGALLNGTWLLCDKVFKLNEKQYINQTFNIDDVNGLDRIFMNPYSKPLDVTADVTLGLSLLTPLCLCNTNAKDWITIGTMYAETLLLVNGIKEIGKLCVNRERPYMYFSDPPAKALSDGDWCKSWPSGHTSFAFAGATFTSYVFSKYYPDSNWKYVVIAGSYTLATTTAILRMYSGNHFFTDVLTGAIIGSACGFLVPWLHTKKILYSGDTIVITPTSVNLKFTF